MDIEFIKNPDTGLFEAWEDGKIVGEFVPAAKLTKKHKNHKNTENISAKKRQLNYNRKADFYESEYGYA